MSFSRHRALLIVVGTAIFIALTMSATLLAVGIAQLIPETAVPVVIGFLGLGFLPSFPFAAYFFTKRISKRWSR